MSAESPTPLLDRIHEPKDLRALQDHELKQLAEELRQELIAAVAVTGGHLGAGLGVVELTIALHHVFDTPADRLIWDVGHQSYPHKILTGRRDRIRTLRQAGGLSGFCKRAESEYDVFGAGHSSTSISAGLGMAVARDLDGKSHNVVAVIGDGAMSAGMAYEAMNNAGAMDSRLIVILNDNDMSIAPPVGAMSAYLAKLISGGTYRRFRRFLKNLAGKLLPRTWQKRAARAEEFTRGFWTGGTLFEELGLLLCRPDRRAQFRSSAARAAQRAQHEERPDPGSCRDPEGQRLRPCRNLGRQVPRRRQVQCRDRRAGGAGRRHAAELHQGIRQCADRGSARRRQDRRHHRGHAVGHGHRPLRRSVSRALVRRRHRRAARGDLRRRTCRRRLEAVCHHLFDLSPARLRPGRA